MSQDPEIKDKNKKSLSDEEIRLARQFFFDPSLGKPWRDYVPRPRPLESRSVTENIRAQRRDASELLYEYEALCFNYIEHRAHSAYYTLWRRQAADAFRLIERLNRRLLECSASEPDSGGSQGPEGEA